MTEEQIKAYLDGRRMTKKALRDNGQAFFVDTYEDADRIIDALEKQIPKKPIICDHSFEAYRCPKCSKCVGVYDLKHEKVIKAYYCSECGTKIDWSEGE